METQCKTNENLCKTYEPPMENIVKNFDCFTVYYAARSAAARILRNFTVYVRLRHG